MKNKKDKLIDIGRIYSSFRPKGPKLEESFKNPVLYDSPLLFSLYLPYSLQLSLKLEFEQ